MTPARNKGKYAMTTTSTTQQPGSGWPSAGLGTIRGRVALVTGGTRGIGAAICRQLAEGGADVAAGYWRDQEVAEKFVASMSEEYPRRITVHEGNIGDPDDCRGVLREVIDQHGRLDILVNNAGITAPVKSFSAQGMIFLDLVVSRPSPR